MAIELLAAGLGTALSFWSEASRSSAEKEALKRRKQAIEEAKYTEEEKEALLSGVERSFNTSALGSTNAAAYGISGVLNSDTVRGINASRLLGERTRLLAETESEVERYNKGLDLQIAEYEGINPQINAGNVLMGGVAGLQIGDAIDRMGNTDFDPDMEQNKLLNEQIGWTEPEDINILSLDDPMGKSKKRRNRYQLDI